jgi:hypothetical protein
MTPCTLVAAFSAGSFMLAAGGVFAAGAPALPNAERAWLTEAGAAPGRVPIARGARAARIVREIRAAMPASGATIVSLQVFAIDRPASALVLTVSRPAFFLHHQLQPIILAMRSSDSHYLRVADTHRRLVIEFYTRGNGGSLTVRPGLERCSPVVAFGWPANLPPCPA